MAIELVQGESRELVFTAASLASLPDSSPIKASGLQTSGYRLYFFVKRQLDDTDEAAVIQKSSPSDGITIESTTVARITLNPADTITNITIPANKRSIKLYASIRFQNTGGTIVYFPAHLEEITLLNAV